MRSRARQATAVPRAHFVEATHAIGDAARMARIVSRLNRLSDPNDIVDAVLGEVTAPLGAKSASIFVLSDGGGSLG